MPIYTRGTYLFLTMTPLSSQILSTGNHLASSQRSSMPTRHQTSQPLTPTFRRKISPQISTPRFYAARVLNNNLLRPFRYCHRTWRDGAVAFRQELIEISSRWKELGLPNDCPYPLPTSDDLVVHRKEFEDFMAAQNLKQRLIRFLDIPSDG